MKITLLLRSDGSTAKLLFHTRADVLVGVPAIVLGEPSYDTDGKLRDITVEANDLASITIEGEITTIRRVDGDRDE